MVDSDELRQEAVNRLRKLIKGELSADEVSKWADSTYFSGSNKELIDSSESLSELFEALNMASLTHDGVSLMYDTESFKQWLNEYEETYKEERRIKKDQENGSLG